MLPFLAWQMILLLPVAENVSQFFSHSPKEGIPSNSWIQLQISPAH